jgi:hypothetical protein
VRTYDEADEGFKYEEPVKNTPDGISEKQRVIKKIPAQVCFARAGFGSTY